MTIGFRPTPELETKLKARGADSERHSIAKRDLERYYKLLERELKQLEFTVAELRLMADLANGTLFEPHTVSLLWANVADSAKEGYGKKWDVDVDVLVGKLRELSFAQTMALVDALECWWQKDNRQATAEGFAAVGLVSVID